MIGNRRLGRRELTKHSQVIDSPIDGPGGEVISAIEVSLKRLQSEYALNLYKHGKLESLKVWLQPRSAPFTLLKSVQLSVAFVAWNSLQPHGIDRSIFCPAQRGLRK